MARTHRSRPPRRLDEGLTLEALMASAPGGRLPMSCALYVGGRVALEVADAHEAGRRVGRLDAAAVRLGAGGKLWLTGEAGRSEAPELSAGGASDVLADVYSVGALLFQLLTGQTVLVAGGGMVGQELSPGQLNPAVDPDLDALIASALSVDPAERPHTARAFQSAIAWVFRELELEPSPEELALLVARAVPEPAAPERDDEEQDEGARWSPPVTRRRWAAAGVGAAALLLWALWPSGRDVEPVAPALVAAAAPAPAQAQAQAPAVTPVKKKVPRKTTRKGSKRTERYARR